MSDTILNGYSVVDRLVLISGLDRDSALQYLPSCTYELNRLLSKLKKGIAAKDYADGLITLAAAQVNRTVAAATLMKNEESFSVGDVSVKNGNTEKAAHAEKFRNEAFASVADILTDEGFAFINIGG